MPNIPASKSSTRQKISRKDKPPVSTTRIGNKFLTSGLFPVKTIGQKLSACLVPSKGLVNAKRNV